MIKIKFPVLFKPKNQETDVLTDLLDGDEDWKLKEGEVREVIFYNIDGIGQYFEDEIEYTSIFTSGGTFTTRLKVAQVERMIDAYFTNQN